MFSAFRKVATEVTIFHHPSSPPSQKALNILRSAVSGPYPPTKVTSAPLDFKLEVVEAPPTADQLKAIMSFVSPEQNASAASVFLSAHPSTPSGSEVPQSVSAIHDIGIKNPNVLKWPIVVDWKAGRVSIGDVEGVKSILEILRKQRDGELPKEEKVDQPKGWFS
ncbi:thioredoxin-like protein [Lentinula aciculospora]|uniref:Thioredoxin-like protein n=1 Tax=Lentinula aciculospora TaxID=153920 RepID=A0A9W9AUA4_9AGAR|nr:thioredoxin-like protein [Lentinula aciculospora]